MEDCMRSVRDVSAVCCHCGACGAAGGVAVGLRPPAGLGSVYNQLGTVQSLDVAVPGLDVQVGLLC